MSLHTQTHVHTWAHSQVAPIDYGSDESDGDAGEFNAPDLDELELPTEGEALGAKGIYPYM